MNLFIWRKKQQVFLKKGTTYAGKSKISQDFTFSLTRARIHLYQKFTFLGIIH